MKPIEEIEVGDKVLAYDEATGEQAYKPVVRLFRNETLKWCMIAVAVAGIVESIISTPGHKYYLPENTINREIGERQEHASYTGLSKKWVSACNLKSGDKVLLSDGEYGIIQSVKVEELSSPETTYNLEVEDFHTYYVGEYSVCVHNTGCGTNKVANDAKEWLGDDAQMVTNKSGDKIFLSGDGNRRIRFDINNPSPHENMHAHIEYFNGNRWKKSGPIFPKGLPHK